MDNFSLQMYMRQTKKNQDRLSFLCNVKKDILEKAFDKSRIILAGDFNICDLKADTNVKLNDLKKKF